MNMETDNYEMNYKLFDFQALNNAHKGWVSGLGIINDILLSCCRGGVIRLWNSKTCESLAELKTDSQIYAVTNTSNRIFTASK